MQVRAAGPPWNAEVQFNMLQGRIVFCHGGNACCCNGWLVLDGTAACRASLAQRLWQCLPALQAQMVFNCAPQVRILTPYRAQLSSIHGYIAVMWALIFMLPA